MLATNLRTVQWPSINSSTCRSINTDRCLKKVLSANVQQKLNSRVLVCSGNEIALLELLAISKLLIFAEGYVHCTKQQIPSNGIGSTKIFTLFPFLYDPKDFEQISQRKSPYDHSCNSILAIITVVPRINENVHTATNFIELKEIS